VSDSKSGVTTPNRPGTNAEASQEPAAIGLEGQASNKKRRHRRRRRRARKPEQDVPADKNVEAAPVSSDTGSGVGAAQQQPDSSAQSAVGDGGSSLIDAKKGKRSQRRRRGGSKHASTTAQADDMASETPTDRNRRKAHSAKRRHQSASAIEADDPQGNVHAPKKKKRPRSRSRNAYAALDLGTNNCRLLVAIPQQPGRFRVIDAFSRIVRLGEGLAASGRLNDLAMDRAVDALKICAGKLDGHRAKGVRLIATEACRRASNGSEFLNRVKRESGLDLEIVDRETEAKLAVAGCSSLVDRNASGVVLFDIGGGSSELALIDLHNRHRYDLARSVVSWTSLPLGVVTLSEKHGGGETVTRGIFNDMVDEVIDILNQFEGRHALTEAAKRGEVHLLGTSGTVTTLAGIHLKLPRYDRRMVDGTWMEANEVENMIETLLGMTFQQRMDNPCIGRNRADLVLAGCAILVAIQKLWPCPRLRVADRGLREGLLTQMMNADNAWQRRPARYRQRGK